MDRLPDIAEPTRLEAIDRRRLLELLPGASTYLIISSLVWASLLFPGPFAVLILAYDAYWLYRSCSLGIRTVVAYRRMRLWQSFDWLAAARAVPNFERVHHLLIVPTYGEPADVLRSTLEHAAQQDFPRERIAVVLAFEARDPGALRNSQLLLDEFRGRFGFLWSTFHPEIPGEVAGKSSNEAWAARFGKERLIDEAGVDIRFTTVTSCDADSRLSPKYFSALTCQFLTKPARRIFQPVILFYANIWRVPAPSRVLNSLHSVWQLAKLTRPDKLIPQSTYSMSLATCVEAGYWDVDVIPEDSHMFFKLLFRFGPEVRVEPIYLPVMADAAQSTSYLGTLKSQFNQEKRWAWGVADIPYVVRGWARGSSTPGTFYRLARYVEEHLNWPIGPFLLTFGGGAPGYFNHRFAASHLGHALPAVVSYLMTGSMVFMLALWVVDWKLKPEAEGARPRLSRLIGLAEWMLLPAIGLVLSALPSLVAHTRLLLGRYLEYNVTEKIPAPVQELSPGGAEPALSVVSVRARDR